MQESKITGTITEENKDKAIEKIGQAETELPILIDIPVGEKNRSTKWSEDDLGLFDLAANVLQTDDSFMPRSFDVAKFIEKKEQFDMISEIRIRAARFLEKLDDTRYAMGSELKSETGVVYTSAKKNSRGSGIDSSVKEMSKWYKRKSRDNGDELPPQQ